MKFKDLYKPSPEAFERMRRVFLLAYREKFPSAVASPWRFGYFVRGLATSAGVIVIFFGLVAYADERNVGPENILYPLKRSQEFLLLNLSNENDKPALHLKFAERRLDEIEHIRESAPENPRIEALTNDLRKEVKNSLNSIRNGNGTPKAVKEQEGSEKEKQQAFAHRKKLSACESLGEFLSERDEVAELFADEGGAELVEKFEKKCGIPGEEEIETKSVKLRKVDTESKWIKQNK